MESIKDWLSWGRAQLAQNGVDDHESMLLMSHCTGRSKASLYAREEDCLKPGLRQQFEQLIYARQQGQPIAYLTGHREFWSLDLVVDSGVLIPRHETELLVERGLFHAQSLKSGSILDLGVGSGAVALALGFELRQWEVLGIELSSAALKVAEKNRHSHQLHNVQFVQGSWFEAVSPVSDADLSQSHSQFHLIVSNPPYIDSSDVHLGQGDVRFEPRSALVSKGGGYQDLKHIIREGKAYLRPNGWTILEHGYQQGEELRGYFAQEGYVDIGTHRDLMGNERVTEGRWSGSGS